MRSGYNPASNRKEWIENIPQLAGYKVKGISLLSRLPELSVSLSQDVWVNSFSTVEGNPGWALIFKVQNISSRSGKIVREIKDRTEPPPAADRG